MFLSLLPLLLSLLLQAASVSLPNNEGQSPKNQASAGLSLPLTGHNGKFYTANMSMDWYGADMRVVVDSGSSDAWFAPTYCEGPTSQCGTTKFNCPRNLGCYSTPRGEYLTREGYKRMDICYDNPPGCINATVTTTLINFEGLKFITTVITAGMLNSSTGIFGDDPQFDGIMGTGRPQDLFVFNVRFLPPIQTVFEYLSSRNRWSKAFFVHFRQGTGSLDLGYSVELHYKKPLNSFEGGSPVLWMLLANEILYGAFKWKSQACEFTTAWPYIGIPDDYFNQLIHSIEAKTIPETTEYAVHCLGKGVAYPDFHFTFDRTTYQLPAAMYVAPDPTGAKKYCRLFLAPSHKQYWILGIPWFEKYYTGFSFDKNRIAIAEAV